MEQRRFLILCKQPINLYIKRSRYTYQEWMTRPHAQTKARTYALTEDITYPSNLTNKTTHKIDILILDKMRLA